MNVRTMLVAGGLCVSVFTAGCASTVAGQPQIASGAVLPTTSQSAPAPFPDPTGDGSSSEDSTSSESTSSESTSDSAPTAITENTPTPTNSSDGDDTSQDPTSATSFPGLSKDCSSVLAGITAFSTVLQTSGSNDEISQGTVEAALAQLPESGLPARPQAGITVLRTVVAGAAGKTVSELGISLMDGKVVTALKDLSSWAEDNCA